MIDMNIVRQPDGKIKKQFWMGNGCEYRIDHEPVYGDHIEDVDY